MREEMKEGEIKLDPEQHIIRFGIMKKEPKENAKSYRIETMQDIYDCITTENADSFIREFEMVIRSVLLMKTIDPVKDDPSLLKFPYFDWIDD